MKWIKTSKKFPDDPEEKIFRRKIGNRYEYIITEDFEDSYLIFKGEYIPYYKIEWLGQLNEEYYLLLKELIMENERFRCALKQIEINVDRYLYLVGKGNDLY